MTRVESFTVAVCCGVLLLLLTASLAGAAEPMPECPAAPAVYDGNDQVVHELRMLRRDTAAACIAARADAENGRGQQRVIADENNGKLDQLRTTFTDQGGEPVTGTVALSNDDRERADAQYAGIRNGQWFPVGIAAAVFVFVGFFWVARPDR